MAKLSLQCMPNSQNAKFFKDLVTDADNQLPTGDQ
jgi:hypothetical protein